MRWNGRPRLPIAAAGRSATGGVAGERGWRLANSSAFGGESRWPGDEQQLRVALALFVRRQGFKWEIERIITHSRLISGSSDLYYLIIELLVRTSKFSKDHPRLVVRASRGEIRQQAYSLAKRSPAAKMIYLKVHDETLDAFIRSANRSSRCFNALITRAPPSSSAPWSSDAKAPPALVRPYDSRELDSQTNHSTR